MMKLGIISDTHGNVEFWDKATELWDKKRIDMVLHAGDILHPGPKNPILGGYNPPLLIDKLNSSNYSIFVSSGNCDSEVDYSLLNIAISSHFFFCKIEDLKILLNHGHKYPTIEDKLNLANNYKVDIFIFGHSHIPMIHEERIILLNPGAAIPLGEPYFPTFGLITLEGKKNFKIELYSAVDLSVYKEKEISLL